MKPALPGHTRWRLVVEYDGAELVGWQVQPEGRSVQALLEAAAAAVVGHPVHVAGAGRTDAGVHALGAVAAFDTAVSRSARAVRDGLNAHLPDDVAVVDAVEAPPDFDPRRWIRHKRYRYTFLDRRARSPLRRGRAWHVRARLDEAAMAAAVAALVGEHDFSSFRAAGCAAAHPVRWVQDARVSRDGAEVHLDVVGHGFLRHMVRIIAGTLVEVGLGRQAPGWMAEVLASRSRSAAGRTAPAHGLTLIESVVGNGPHWDDPEAGPEEDSGPEAAD